MKVLKLSHLERLVLEKLLDGDHAVLRALRIQLESCCVTKREFTEVGFFSELEVDRTLPAAPTTWQNLVISKVVGEIVGLEHGAGFVLFVRSGYLGILEGYTYGPESWPTEDIVDVELRYLGGARDLDSLELDGPST